MCVFNAAMSQICNHTLYDIESPPVDRNVIFVLDFAKMLECRCASMRLNYKAEVQDCMYAILQDCVDARGCPSDTFFAQANQRGAIG